jgi:hypothetical protein
MRSIANGNGHQPELGSGSRGLAPRTRYTSVPCQVALAFRAHCSCSSLDGCSRAKVPPMQPGILSMPLAFQSSDFGVPDFDALISDSAPSVAYAPPAAGMLDGTIFQHLPFPWMSRHSTQKMEPPLSWATTGMAARLWYISFLHLKKPYVSGTASILKV